MLCAYMHMCVKILQCELLPLGMCISLGCGRDGSSFSLTHSKHLSNFLVLQCAGCQGKSAGLEDQH